MFIVYTKTNCPFCIRAKSLLKSRGLEFTEISVTEPSQLPKPEFRTVPQIVHATDGFIGGFQELEKYFALREVSEARVAPPVRRNTVNVFNPVNTGHLTGKYPLFLGEELGFADNINNPYPVLEELYDQQMAQIWNHTEIDLTQDRQDMLSAPPEVTDLVVQNLLWQTLADSVASRAIGSVLTKHVSNSALQDLYNAVILFESIHSKTYLHIIRQTLVDPNEALKKGYSNLAVIKRSNVLVDAFNNLANCKNDRDIQKLVLFCVIAMYLLEEGNFMNSFAVTFAVAEAGWFQGIGQDVRLICRDEMLHAKIGLTLINILKQQWPDLWNELIPEIKRMVDAVRQDEKAWSAHLFSEGRQLIGLNQGLLDGYADHRFSVIENNLGFREDILPLNLPYMVNWIDASRVQVAAQEMQLTAYLVNSVKASSPEVMEATLADLRALYL